MTERRDHDEVGRALERMRLAQLLLELVEVNGPADPDAVARFVEEWR